MIERTEKVSCNRVILCGAAALASLVAAADWLGAPADARHAWAVHDDYRPGVKKITADGVKPPSDAIVLFDGTAKSLADNWCDGRGKPTRWTLDPNGELISVRGAGSVFTKRKFADCQLHVEWAAPTKVSGFGQGRGNSGVFLMGDYEIQVLDSYETDPDKNPNPNPNYSDGQAGAVYGQNPPAVNPTRAPGVFNTYDIIFHAPVLNADGSVKLPATVTVLFNGVLVQDGWKLDGPTLYRRRTSYPKSPSTKGPIGLQDHGNPVHYRNIWIREIPPQGANVTHGNYYADESKVLEQRRATATRLDAEFDAKWGSAKVGRKLLEAWRVATYDPTPARLARAAALEREFLAAANGLSSRDLPGKAGISKGELNTYYGYLSAAGLVKKGNEVSALLGKMK